MNPFHSTPNDSLRLSSLAPKSAFSLIAFLGLCGAAAAQGRAVPSAPVATPDIHRIADPSPAPTPAEVRAGPSTTAIPRAHAEQPVTAAVTPAVDHSRLYFDRDATGALWVRGRTYKARFDGNGITYIPYLGARAPRNFPVTLRLESATVGSRALDVASRSGAELDGTTVVIARGELSERYELALDSIEQTFVLNERPGNGDLAVKITVDSELAPNERTEGFEFANEHGSVRYGRAAIVDGRGARTSVATRADVGHLSIDVPSAVLAGAEFPLTIDPVLSTFALYNDSVFDSTLPDVAYDATNDRYMVVFEEPFSANDYDVFTKTVNSSGSFVSYAYAESGEEDWREPSVANLNGSNQFLVVAQSRDIFESTWRRIRARSCSATTGTFAPAAFTVSGSETGDKLTPEVGGDPFSGLVGYYCVTWLREFTLADHDVCARLVRADGTLVGTSTTFITNDSSEDTAVSISKSDGFDGTTTQARWSIVWQRLAASGNHDIWCAQIQWDGTLVTAPFAVTTSSLDDTNPSVSSILDGGGSAQPYLVAFERAFSDRDIEGYVFDGSTFITASNLSSIVGVNQYEQQIQPHADSDGSQFAVVCAESFMSSTTDYDPYISSFYLVGGTLNVSEAHRALAYTDKPEFHPRVTSTYSSGGARGHYMAAWDDLILGETQHDIWAAFYDGPIGGPVTSLCFGDGSGSACPCANNGASGHGCASSVNPGGALLTGAGHAALFADTLVLAATGMPSAATCLFFQSTSSPASGTIFGDGLRCTSGTVIRLGNKTASAGAASYPTGTDPHVSIRGLVPATGGPRFYQVWYRNSAAFCTAATFNLTNGLKAVWLP